MTASQLSRKPTVRLPAPASSYRPAGAGASAGSARAARVCSFLHAVYGQNFAPGQCRGLFRHRRRAGEARVMIEFILIVVLLLLLIGIFVRREVFK